MVIGVVVVRKLAALPVTLFRKDDEPRRASLTVRYFDGHSVALASIRSAGCLPYLSK